MPGSVVHGLHRAGGVEALLTKILAAVLGLALLFVMVAAGLAAPPEADQQARHLYDRVMQEFQRQDYEAALAGFRFFLELHGDSPLAGSAQYWAGECEFRLGRYQNAIAAFERVRTRYPKSPKLASALLKSALSHARLGQARESQALLNRILVEFPDRPEAKLARRALESPDFAAHTLVAPASD